MLAKQIARGAENFCTTDTPLTEVFQKLMETKCECLPVVESPAHRNIIGTITEHDICLKTITDGLNPKQMRAGRVMNGNFTTVAGEATAEECAELLNLTGAERLFVVDDNHSLIGVLTETDVQPEKGAANSENIFNDLRLTASAPSQLTH